MAGLSAAAAPARGCAGAYTTGTHVAVAAAVSAASAKGSGDVVSGHLTLPSSRPSASLNRPFA